MAIMIHNTPRFRLESYHNGAAYVMMKRPVDHRPEGPLILGASFFVQGDDATTFRERLDAYSEVFDDFDKALSELWNEYAPEDSHR